MKLNELLNADDPMEKEVIDWIYMIMAGTLNTDVSSAEKLEWCRDYSIKNGEIYCSGSANFAGKAFHLSGGEIKYKFGTVEVDFRVNNTSGLRSIKNFPRRVGRSIDISSSKIQSLKGIHKEIEEIGFEKSSLSGIFDLSLTPIKSNILGLCLIKGIKKVAVNFSTDKRLVDAVKIINKHLGKGKTGTLAAQQELIDADLEEFAEL